MSQERAELRVFSAQMSLQGTELVFYGTARKLCVAVFSAPSTMAQIMDCASCVRAKSVDNCRPDPQNIPILCTT